MNFETKSVKTSNFENSVSFTEISKEHSLFPQVKNLFNQIIAPHLWRSGKCT